MTEEPLPFNPEAERALLGAILVNNQALDTVSRFLTPEQFHEPVHGQIFGIILDLAEQGRKADPVTVVDRLPKMLNEDLSAKKYVAHLAANATTIINAPDYAKTVHDLWVRRGLAVIGEDMASVARNPPRELMTAAAQLDDAEQRISELRDMGRFERSQGMSFHLEASIEAMASAYKDDKPIGLDWCLPEIERAVDTRMEPGDLIGMLGASGDAKSSLALTQVRFSAEQGVPVLFLSGEQSVQQCIRQMTAQKLGIQAKHIKSGRVSEAEFAAVVEDARAIGQLPLMIETWTDMRVGQLGARIRAFNRRFGRGLVVIDHAKKIIPDHRSDILAQQVFQIFDSLKGVAMQTGNAVLLLMQRNSDFLKRRVMRPVRADSYGGEGPLQNLDACFSIYRPSRWLREQAKIEERDDRRRQLIDDATQMDLRAGGTVEDGITLAQLYCLKSRFGDDQLPHQDLRFEGRYTRLTRIQRSTAQAEMAEML